MSTARLSKTAKVVYPESDGKPMAENTLQYQWIVTIKEGIEAVFADRPDVFVAGDLFWYPVENQTRIVQAPDVLVAIGRPRGHRGSYVQCEEGGVAPQVVFEVISPSNTASEMAVKRAFYQRYGVREYYEYDPGRSQLRGWVRRNRRLQPITEMQGWTSPTLGIRFEMDAGQFRLFSPDAEEFQTVQEIVRDRREERRLREWEHQARLTEHRRAETNRRRAEKEKQRAEKEKQRAEKEKQRADALAERLRALGIDPDQPG